MANQEATPKHRNVSARRRLASALATAGDKRERLAEKVKRLETQYEAAVVELRDAERVEQDLQAQLLGLQGRDERDEANP